MLEYESPNNRDSDTTSEPPKWRTTLVCTLHRTRYSTVIPSNMWIKMTSHPNLPVYKFSDMYIVLALFILRSG